MDYLKQLNVLRDELHKKIVHLVISSQPSGWDYILELDEPLETSFTVRSRQTDRLITTQVDLTGIDGVTGELYAETADGTGKKLYYHDLTIEQLVQLHNLLLSNSFTILEKKNVRNLIPVS